MVKFIAKSQKNTFKVCVFGAYDRNFTANKIVIDGLRENGIKVLEINAHTPVTRLNRKNDLSIFRLLGRLGRKAKIIPEIIKNLNELRACDVIYVGYPGHVDVLIAYPLAKIFRKKIVFNPLIILSTIFMDDFSLIKPGGLLSRFIVFGEKLVYTMSDLILADTQIQKKYLMRLFQIPHTKIAVFPVGADNKAYKKSLRQPKKNSVFKVIYYGMYTPLHGVEHIIECARLSKNDKTIRYLLIGSGKTYIENRNRAKKFGLTNIDFYPDMTEANALSTLQTADVFLGFLQKHPTVTRTIPNKVYQGLALGIAVITANTPAIREFFISGKNIYVCEAGDAKSLYEAIMRLKTNRKLKEAIAEAGYNLFQRSFTPLALGREFRRIINGKFEFALN